MEGGFAWQTVEPWCALTVHPCRWCAEVIVASPHPAEVTKATSFIADADCLLAVGGAQAVAALAYGVGVKPCVIIVGPENQYVTAAKSIVNGLCGIDTLAVPSVVLVIAVSWQIRGISWPRLSTTRRKTLLGHRARLCH